MVEIIVALIAVFGAVFPYLYQRNKELNLKIADQKREAYASFLANFTVLARMRQSLNKMPSASQNFDRPSVVFLSCYARTKPSHYFRPYWKKIDDPSFRLIVRMRDPTLALSRVRLRAARRRPTACPAAVTIPARFRRTRVTPFRLRSKRGVGREAPRGY